MNFQLISTELPYLAVFGNPVEQVYYGSTSDPNGGFSIGAAHLDPRKGDAEIPPLHERPTDIPILVDYFVHRLSKRAGKKITGISSKTLELLQSYPWPGNIRELQNVIERAVIVSDGELLTVDSRWLAGQSTPSPASKQPLGDALGQRERAMIEGALAETKGRVSGPSGAAAKLGVPRSTLESKIRSLGLNKNRFKT